METIFIYTSFFDYLIKCEGFSDIIVIRNVDFFGSELVQFILILDHKFSNHQFENQFKVKVHEKPLETPFIS